MSQQAFFKFLVETESFWMNVQDIQLVSLIEHFQVVPRTPPLIKGVAEVRGKIITLIELSPLFQLDSNGEVPFHAAILSPPFNHLAICLYSDFDILENIESFSFTEVKTKEPDHDLGVRKRLKIKSEEYRFLEAEELVHICENHIKEQMKKNLPIISSGDKS